MLTLLTKLTNVEVFLTIVFLIAIIGLIFPYGFPLLGFVVILFFILFFLKRKLKIKLNIGMLILFICSVQYIGGVLLTNGVIYNHNIAELTNIVLFMMVAFILGSLNNKRYKYFIMYVKKYGVFIISIFAFIGLYKFTLMLNNNFIKFFYTESGRYPNGTSLVNDYNMFAFGILAILFFSISSLVKQKRIGATFYYLCTTFILIITATLAGSRRAWIILAIITVFLSLYLLIVIFRKLSQIFIRFKLKVTGKNFILAVFVFAILLIMPRLVDNVSQEYNDSSFARSLQYRFQTLEKDQISNSLTPRIIRWEYGLQLVEEGEPWQVVFGQGFNYLSKYSCEFNTSGEEDYPHNPFISGLLYSGVFGALMLVFLLILPLYYLIKYYYMYGWEFIALYCLALSFLLISSNSIFSNDLLMIIIIIIFSAKPNRIYYLHNKEINSGI